MIRLLVTGDLAAGAEVAPSPEQGRYLATVMRLKPGDPLLLFNGRDGEWLATLSAVEKRGVRIKVESATRPQAFPPDLDLVVALVKRARLETIVEKATELGVRRIRLLITRRTNADHTNLARLSAIAAEAAEQTRRLDAPLLQAPQKLEPMLREWDSARSLVFCDEAGDDPDQPWGGPAGRAGPALQVLDPGHFAADHAAQQSGGAGAGFAAQHSRPAAVLIGPEGGFDPEERALLRSLPFVAPISLGPRILRADTAAIAALTLWQAAVGDWR